MFNRLLNNFLLVVSIGVFLIVIVAGFFQVAVDGISR
jgi:hypothetical protein